uniref:Pyruvate dehydrogenase E2 component n=1 Tax=uncultured organism TaxID=155900 RepID=G8DB22_9ZZZZ|nr:pyruvate dehydrogenase E2 component [uncultured organism]
MKKKMLIPRFEANDNSVKIIEWLVNDRVFIKKNTPLLNIETSKTFQEIKSKYDGFIKKMCQEGDTLHTGDIFIEFYTKLEDLLKKNTYFKKKKDTVLSCKSTYQRFSKKAKKILLEKNIDISSCTEELITTKVLNNITNEIRKDKKNKDLIKYFPNLEVKKNSDIKNREISVLEKSDGNIFSSSIMIQLSSEKIRENIKKIPKLNGQIFPYLMYFYIQELSISPKFTAFYREKNIIYYNRINLGILIDNNNILQIIVLKDANKFSLLELQNELIDKICRCYENNLEIDDVVHSTTSVSDLSGNNIISFQPIINQKQSVILGIGGDTNLLGKPITFNIVFDHRILNGKEVAIFLENFKRKILQGIY